MSVTPAWSARMRAEIKEIRDTAPKASDLIIPGQDGDLNDILKELDLAETAISAGDRAHAEGQISMVKEVLAMIVNSQRLAAGLEDISIMLRHARARDDGKAPGAFN